MEQKRAYRILAINPGSTSTKVGVFDGEKLVVEKVVRHSDEELKACGTENGIYGQKDLRKKLVLECLAENRISLESLDATVGRAARLPPMNSGTYIVDQGLMAVLPNPIISPAPLGMIIAKEIGDQLNIPAFIVDPSNVDEYCDEARITGIPEIQRVSMSHTLNQKAMARRAAAELGKEYEECKFVVAHLGGGISIGAHYYGRLVDSTRGDEGEGPYSPTRAGYVPCRSLLKLCFSGKYTPQEVEDFFNRTGGVLAHLGVNDMRDVEQMVLDGDEKAALVFNVMTYNVAKTIGQMFAVLDSEVDGIVLTGGIAFSELFCSKVIKKVGKMARVFVYPGEEELLSMVKGVLRVLDGVCEVQVFKGRKT